LESGDPNDKPDGDWKYLGKEIRRRTREPFAHVPFVFYVILAIIGLGCLGIWVELIKLAVSPGVGNWEGVLTALATFFPALIGASSHHLILASTGSRDKVLASFGYAASTSALVGAALIAIFHKMVPNLSFWAAVVFALAAIWLWWFTNGDDPTYKSARIDAASGGDPDRAPKGDTSGFRE
jgi:hypothetical protein